MRFVILLFRDFLKQNVGVSYLQLTSIRAIFACSCFLPADS